MGLGMGGLFVMSHNGRNSGELRCLSVFFLIRVSLYQWLLSQMKVKDLRGRVHRMFRNRLNNLGPRFQRQTVPHPRNDE